MLLRNRAVNQDADGYIGHGRQCGGRYDAVEEDE